MQFSVYEPNSKRYLYYASMSPFYVKCTDSYIHAPFINWADAIITLPPDAVPTGSGETPKGIIVHPQELDNPPCKEKLDIAWLWLVGIWKLLFG